VTPLVLGERLVISGLNKGLLCYRLSSGRTRPELAWENKDVSLYMSSPVAVGRSSEGQRLVCFSHRKKGQMALVDLQTGKTLWSGEGRQGDNAALVRTGSIVWALLNTAELVAYRPRGESLEQLASYKAAATPTWAHPVLLDEGVLVKDEERLTLWRWK
jgi:hypothetical protein